MMISSRAEGLELGAFADFRTFPVGELDAGRSTREMPVSTDDMIVQTPDGPMTWAEWKKRHPIQIPSRRTKGKKLPVKVKRFTSDT
jgi:hypothetical protein